MTFIHFAIFNENFTELYCVNKDKPEMECNGKCHLMQETQENVPVQDDVVLNESLHEQILLFIEGTITLNLEETKVVFNTQDNFQFKQNYFFCYLKEVFHPPNV